MKSRETSIRLQRFEVSERRQKLADIEMMIADFKRMANDLEHQIKVEQEASGIKDVKHFAYSTFAKAAAQRRDNLLSSIRGLEKKFAEAQADVDAALEELRKIELADERETGRNEDATPAPLTPAPQEPLTPASSGGSFAAQGSAPAKRPDTSEQALKQEAARSETPRQDSRQEALRQPASRQGGNLRLIGGP